MANDEIKDGGTVSPTFKKSFEFDDEYLKPEGGLTRRDYFAGMALQGCLANETYLQQVAKATEGDAVKATETIVQGAFMFADYMLKESSGK